MDRRRTGFERGWVDGMWDAAEGLTPVDSSSLGARHGDEYAAGYAAAYDETLMPDRGSERRPGRRSAGAVVRSLGEKLRRAAGPDGG